MDVFKVSYFEAVDKLPEPSIIKIGNFYKKEHYIEGNSKEEIIGMIKPFFKKDGYGEPFLPVITDTIDVQDPDMDKAFKSIHAYCLVEKINFTKIQPD